MLEHYFTLGTGGSAPRNFRSILSYLEHQVQKKTILPHLPLFTIIIIIIIIIIVVVIVIITIIVIIIVIVDVAFFFLLFRSCTFPYSTNFSLFNIFATRVQCAAVDRCHSVAESRVSCFQASEIDLRRARYTWHRLAKVDSSSNRAGTLNIAVRMREVRARPRVGVCAPLSSSLAQK